MLVIIVVRNAVVSFQLIDTNGSHVKEENERLQLWVRVVVKTSNLKFHVVVWQIRQRIAAQGVSHVQHDDFSSFGQSRY